MGAGQIFGFVADSFIGNKTLVVNAVLTAICLFRVGLSPVLSTGESRATSDE